jgi:hypothetical protein
LHRRLFESDFRVCEQAAMICGALGFDRNESQQDECKRAEADVHEKHARTSLKPPRAGVSPPCEGSTNKRV